MIDGGGAVGLAVIVLMYLAHRRVLAVPLPRRIPGALAGDGARRSPRWRIRPRGSGRSSACRPMRWIGERSYGIYLWHFPIIVLTTPEGDHAANPVRAFFQVAAIMIVAALSWKYVEDPIRHGALGRYWKRMRAGAWRRETLSPRARAVTLASGLVLAAAIAGLAGVGGRPEQGEPARRPDRGRDDHGGQRRQVPWQPLSLRGPYRRLDLRGPDLGRLPAQSKAADHRPSTSGSGRRPSTSRSPARGRSTRRSRAIQTRRTLPRRGRAAASTAAGCWPWGRTRPPTSPPARPSGSTSGSTR